MKQVVMKGCNGFDPSTGLPLPTADITEHEALEWILFMCEKAQELDTIISFPVTVGVGLATALMDINYVNENDRNRPFRSVHAAHLAQEIRQFRWACNGQPIIVSVNGYMNDGQHRCDAVITTKIPIRTCISIGATRQSRTTVDLGSKKTSADHLYMKGEKYANLASSATRYLAQYEKKMTIGATSGKVKAGQATPASGNWISTNEGTEYYTGVKKEVQDVISLLTASRLNKSSKILTSTLAIMVTIVLRRVDQAKALVFMEQLLDGIGYNNSTDPVYVARKRLEQGAPLSHHAKVELLFRAWNSWRRERQVKKFDLTGDLPELAA